MNGRGGWGDCGWALIAPSADEDTLLVEACESLAAERALDHYLASAQIMATPYKPSSMFMVNPQTDTESLLANACESLSSISLVRLTGRVATRCRASPSSDAGRVGGESGAG